MSKVEAGSGLGPAPINHRGADPEKAALLVEMDEPKADVPPTGKAVATAHKVERILGVPAVVVAGVCYCLASTAMVLLNKAVLSSFKFNSPNAILLFQCFVCVVCVKLGEALQLLSAPVEPFSRKLLAMWFPVNLIFTGMIGTSFWALRSMNVAMVTVLKQLTNLIILAGDYYFYGRTYGWSVWGSMGLMIAAAVAGAVTDLTFNLMGYFYQLINCGFTAAYSLYLRGVMDRVKTVTSTGEKLNESSMVFYNNLFSLPLVLVLMMAEGEVGQVLHEPDLYNRRFQLALLVSGLLSFGLGFCSLWFLHTTTPTIHSLVGSLNKAPLALMGLFIFNVPWSAQNMASIVLGLVAGTLFVWAKSRGH